MVKKRFVLQPEIIQLMDSPGICIVAVNLHVLQI